MTRALVTGATRNLGEAIARRLAGAGYEVLVNGTSADAVGRVVSAIRDGGGRALACPADVTSIEGLAEAIRAAAPDGDVGILVNNAVKRAFGSALEVDTGEWNRSLAVTLTGALNSIKCVLPGMRRNGFGRIINIAGVSGQTGMPNRVAISTAKAGLIGLTRATAIELAADGITVNAVSPGTLDTDRREEGRHYHEDGSGIPVGRLGTVDDVAAMVTYLAAEDAGFITGQVIGVNGGLLT